MCQDLSSVCHKFRLWSMCGSSRCQGSCWKTEADVWKITFNLVWILDKDKGPFSYLFHTTLSHHTLISFTPDGHEKKNSNVGTFRYRFRWKKRRVFFVFPPPTLFACFCHCGKLNSQTARVTRVDGMGHTLEAVHWQPTKGLECHGPYIDVCLMLTLAGHQSAAGQIIHLGKGRSCCSRLWKLWNGVTLTLYLTLNICLTRLYWLIRLMSWYIAVFV